MAIEKINEASMSPEKTIIRRRKLAALLNSDHNQHTNDFTNYNHIPHRNKTNLSFTANNSDPSSPCNSDSTSSPYANSPWIRDTPDHNHHTHETDGLHDMKKNSKFGLIGSIHREEGHIYSLAARGNLLYTGSDSKNIRVWKDLEDFSGFKSGSGLVKAIVLFGDRIFTGHQDGKIRVWSLSDDDDECNAYKRVGNLPTTRDLLVKSVNRRNYVKVRRNRNVPWIKHYDAVSCMSIDEDKGLLYSGSWDRTLKVWRISDSKCLESIRVHDDAVNSVVVAFDGVVFTGSADGSVKAWRRVTMGNNFTKHVLVETLLKQDHAVTSLAVSNVSGKATLYAGSSDGLVSFWEREKNFMSYGGVLRGHKMAVLCMVTAGNLVMSGSADNSICVWRRDGGGAHACVAVLTGHDGPVKCLTAEKEEEEGNGKGWIVYSGSLDKSVKVWRVSENGTSGDDDTCFESINDV